MNIEKVLCSKTRLKILKILMHSDLLNVSELARQVGVSYVKTSEHLKVLEDEDILTHIMFGKKTRLYKFNELSPKAKAARNLMKAFATN